MIASSTSPTAPQQTEPTAVHLFRVGRSSTSCCDLPFAAIPKTDLLTYWPEMVTCGKPESVPAQDVGPAPNYRVCPSCWPLLTTEPKPPHRYTLHPEVCGRCGILTYSGLSIERTTELYWDSEGNALPHVTISGKSS